MIGIVTFVFMLGGFMRNELELKSGKIYIYVDNTFDKHESGVYDLDDITKRINAIAEVENCGIELTFINDSNHVISSERYLNYNYPDSIIDSIGAFIYNKMYSSKKIIYYINPTTDNMDTVTLKIIHPITLYYKQLNTLSIMLLTCIVFGFFFIWFFGSLNNKRILKPIYAMTKTAEKISITNMNERLDVSKAKYELKDLAITINDMLNRLNVDYEKQKRFVSDVSHELRTPISIVNGYASMLKRWGKEDEAILDESIEAIIDEAKNMQVLVENLLTLVRADNQSLKFNKEEFYMNELIEEVATESLMINAKKQEIVCEPCEPIKVFLDMQMMKQILRIFVDNAVKYTPPSGRIFIKCLIEDSNCVIHIKDSGIGISKEDLPFIFDRFYRSDESRTRDTGGHGLGLSIAKAIILGHGGRMKVKSKKNEGSEFTIILPI
jgi:signal transduction histidine kinase